MLIVNVLSIVTFNWTLLLWFLTGVGVGMAVFALIYLLLLLSSMRKKRYIVKSQVEQLDDQIIKDLIEETQKLFKDKTIKGDNSSIAHCQDLCVNLTKNISRKFFPNSKHPLLELSIDETLMLIGYIQQRLDEMLDIRGLRLIRKIKISTIVGLGETKQALDESALMKATKKYRIKEALSSAIGVINVVNPVFWVRKLVVNNMIGVVVNKICLVMIGIVGEETYKIYSKSVFNEDVQIDMGLDTLVKDINEDLENSKE